MAIRAPLRSPRAATALLSRLTRSLMLPKDTERPSDELKAILSGRVVAFTRSTSPNVAACGKLETGEVVITLPARASAAGWEGVSQAGLLE
jgi:hypothetical protein